MPDRPFGKFRHRDEHGLIVRTAAPRHLGRLRLPDLRSQHPGAVFPRPDREARDGRLSAAAEQRRDQAVQERLRGSKTSHRALKGARLFEGETDAKRGSAFCRPSNT